MNPLQPKVAIVILNFNGRKFMEQFLPAVVSSAEGIAEVVIADNASTDDSIAFLDQQFPALRLIRFKKNGGFAKGYNDALALVEADYYVLLNSDVEVSPGWIQPVIRLLESDPGIAACQPKLKAYHDKKLFEYAGAAGGWIDGYGYPFARGRVFDTLEEDQGQYDQAAPIFWASGAAMFVRASVYHEMKGFDEFFFAHQEEIDLCWRMHLAGYRIYSCPESVVYHVGGGTLPHGNTLKTFLNFRNNLIMLYKNWPWTVKWWKLPFRMALDGVSAWKGLLAGQGGYFKAIIRAHLAFVKWVILQQGASVFPQQKGGVPEGVYPGNLVWQYFVRKKRIFREIVKPRGL
ncbi:MAG: glycosyltransferase family 2 protein [Chitinophagaceae bacterium]|nr:glycosyltransferase family 2 protein [Chitinophagaceae bacterium]